MALPDFLLLVFSLILLLGSFFLAAETLHLIDIVLVILVGLSLGSFATALAYRLPRGLPYARDSAGRPVRSICPPCGKTLTPRELIPVVSWVLQRGRCACGKKKVPVTYPSLEILTLAVTIGVYAAGGFNLAALPRYAALPFVVAGLVMAWNGQSWGIALYRVLLPFSMIFAVISLLTMYLNSPSLLQMAQPVLWAILTAGLLVLSRRPSSQAILMGMGMIFMALLLFPL